MIHPPVDHAPPAPRYPLSRAVLLVIGVQALVGALIGAKWAWLAPPIHGVIALTKSGERVHVPLGTEGDHFFVAAVLMLGMVTVSAVVAAAAAWQWRAHRGPQMVVALTLGSVAAAGAAAGVGAALVRLRYGVLDIAGAPVSPEHKLHYVTQAPAVFFGHSPAQIAATILLPSAAAALVYAVCAAACVREDLGGYPPQQRELAPLLPTVGG